MNGNETTNFMQKNLKKKTHKNFHFIKKVCLFEFQTGRVLVLVFQNRLTVENLKQILSHFASFCDAMSVLFKRCFNFKYTKMCI